MPTRTHRLGGPVVVTGDATVALWTPSAETHLVKNLRVTVTNFDGFANFVLLYGRGATDSAGARYGQALISSPATMFSDDTWFVFEPGEQMYVRLTRATATVVAFGALLTNGGE